mgnify:CR=1 FL=1
MDPMFAPPAWYYVDSWLWVPSTWGGGGGQWLKETSKGPFYESPWSADFETTWQENNLRTKGKYIVRRYRWTGSTWIREV